MRSRPPKFDGNQVLCCVGWKHSLDNWIGTAELMSVVDVVPGESPFGVCIGNYQHCHCSRHHHPSRTFTEKYFNADRDNWMGGKGEPGMEVKVKRDPSDCRWPLSGSEVIWSKWDWQMQQSLPVNPRKSLEISHRHVCTNSEPWRGSFINNSQS